MNRIFQGKVTSLELHVPANNQNRSYILQFHLAGPDREALAEPARNNKAGQGCPGRLCLSNAFKQVYPPCG
jgi:hypothetical protein